MKYYLITLLILLVVISGCATYEGTTSESFKVKFKGESVSPGAAKILDITYTVKNGEIISCDGTYTVSPSSSQFEKTVEECDISRITTTDIQKRYYTASHVFVTKPSETKGSKVIDHGSVEWEILE